MFLHVVNLMSNCLQFYQYLIILIVPILQFYFELLFLLQSALQILDRYVLLLYDMFVFYLQIKKSKQNIDYM
jgi:hypothetical protein